MSIDPSFAYSRCGGGSNDSYLLCCAAVRKRQTKDATGRIRSHLLGAGFMVRMCGPSTPKRGQREQPDGCEDQGAYGVRPHESQIEAFLTFELTRRNTTTPRSSCR